MRTRFKSALLMIVFLIVGCLVLGGFYISYAHLVGKEPYIKVSGPLSINFATGNHIEVKGHKTSEISIINDSEEDAYYYIEFKNVKNVTKAKYKITNNDDINIESELLPYNAIISSYILIKAGEVEKFTCEFTSDNDEEFSLDIDINMETLESSSFADTIIKNNEVKKNPLTKVGAEIATENEGLIESTDDNGTTYYFRGNVDNNYVLINDLLFRIVRINGDGSIKLVLNDNLENLSAYYEEHINLDNSVIINSLKNWLITSLGEYNNIVATQKYCNDLTKTDNAYLANERLTVDNIPTFYCLSDSYSSKVALLTADEIVYAGGVYGLSNENYYLYNDNTSANAFTMTSAFENGDATYFVFSLASDGSLTTTAGTAIAGVRPVITINKTAAVVSGNGTVNNPYILGNN